MAEINLGRVVPVYQGEYNTTKSYEVLDRVTYNGSYYECIQDTEAGVAPTDIKHWALLGRIAKDGSMPNHKWNGTQLSFENPDGSYDDGVDLKGDEGLSVIPITISDSIKEQSSNILASAKAVKSSMTSIDDTAEELNDCPLGSILIWSGELDGAGHPIYNGKTYTSWQLCNGRNGTPDLTGAILQGADHDETIGGNTGIQISNTEESCWGACVAIDYCVNLIDTATSAHSHSFTTDPFTISTVTTTTSIMEAHTHTTSPGFADSFTFKATLNSWPSHAWLTTCNNITLTLGANSSDTHTHSRYNNSATAYNILPYTCIYYIMKVKEQTTYTIKMANPINLHWFYKPITVTPKYYDLAWLYQFNYIQNSNSFKNYNLGSVANSWYPGQENVWATPTDTSVSYLPPLHSDKPFMMDAGGEIIMIDDNGKTYDLLDMYSNMRRGSTIDPSLDIQIQDKDGDNIPQIGIIDFLEDCTKSAFCMDYVALTPITDVSRSDIEAKLTIKASEVGTYYFGVTAVKSSNTDPKCYNNYCIWGCRTLINGTTRIERVGNADRTAFALVSFYDTGHYACFPQLRQIIQERLPEIYKYTPRLYYNIECTNTSGNKHIYTLPTKMRLGCQFVDPTGKYPELHLLKKYLFNIDTTQIDDDWQTAYTNGNTVGSGTSVTLTNGDNTYEFTYPLNENWIKPKLESMGYSTSYADGFYWGYKTGYYTKNNPTTDTTSTEETSIAE